MSTSTSDKAPAKGAVPGGTIVLCPCCSCEVHCPPSPLSGERPFGAGSEAPKHLPKPRGEKLTPEQRAQNKKDSMKRWYERTKEERREAKMLWARQHYVENREVILARLRESRRRKKEEKKAAEEAAEEAAPSAAQATPAGLE